MDSLQQHDLEVAIITSPSEKARQALEAMRYGIALARAGLCVRHPGATEREIDDLLSRWLAGDA